MTDLFLTILNMSISATWLVLAVVLLRLVLKKAPRWIHVVLWGLVAVRLICPFTPESTLSLIPSAEVIPSDIAMSPAPAIHTGIEAVNSAVNPVIQESLTPNPAASVNPLQVLLAVAANLWLLGAAVMAVYAVISYWRLRRRVRMAIRVKKGIYLSEYVDSPFVLGVFRPRIYLPYHMPELDRYHVLAHERAHIRRKDHLWKPFGYLLLSIHWFNPLMWLAYILLCRDIEMACDEKVIRELGSQQRADYSQALLHCSAHRSLIAACPVAFGEVGVRERVKKVLHYKKPAFWVIVLAVIACIVVAVCFLTDPRTELSFMGKPITHAVALDNETPDTTGMLELNGQELEQLSRLLTELDSIEDYTGTEYDDYLHRYYLRVEPEGCDLVQVYVFSWDTGPVVLEYQESLYEIKDDAFSEFLLTLYNRGFIVTAQGEDCGITLEVAEAASTGMTIYIHEPEYPEDVLVLDDSNFRLQHYERGAWTDVEDLPGSEGYRINCSIGLSEEGRPLKLSWVTRYGELPAGSYRLLNDYIFITDSNPVRYTVSVEFRIGYPGEDHSDLLSAALPLSELPSSYSLEQATIDGCVIMADGDIRDNQDVWEDFISSEQDGNAATVRCVRYNHTETGSSMFIYDVIYDGSRYTLRGLLDGKVFERSFKYLIDTTGQGTGEDGSFDAYQCFYLSNELDTSLILTGFVSDLPINPDQDIFVVYSDLVYFKETPEIPELSKAVLSDNGTDYLTITAASTLTELHSLLSSAEWLGYYPKTPNFGPTLTLYGTRQEMVILQLDLQSDMIEIDGDCFDYGPGYDGFGSNNDIFRLWQLLGLTQWTVPNLSKWPDGINRRYFTGESLTDTVMNRMFSCLSFSPEEDSFSLTLKSGKQVDVAKAQQDEIWAYLCYAPLDKSYDGGPDTSEAEYTVAIHDSGWNMECLIYYLGDDNFCVKRTIDDHIYTCTDPKLSEIISKNLP